MGPLKLPTHPVQSVTELQAEHVDGHWLQTKVTPEPVPEYPVMQLSHSSPE